MLMDFFITAILLIDVPIASPAKLIPIPPVSRRRVESFSRELSNNPQSARSRIAAQTFRSRVHGVTHSLSVFFFKQKTAYDMVMNRKTPANRARRMVRRGRNLAVAR